MKHTIYLIFILFAVSSLVSAQNLMDADYISTMHEGFAAVKKGNQWAFVNLEGQIAINYRDDLVVTNAADGNYPLFINDRCLITQKRDGISYFGYIDSSGKTVIEAQYLNATNFQNDLAIALLLKRTEISENVALKKPVVSYDYFEVVIDLSGKVLTYLNVEPTHITLSSEYLRKPPTVNSKFISNTHVAVMNSQKKWSVVKIDLKQ